MTRAPYWPAANASRGALLAFCERVDHNGCWSDAQCDLQGIPRATVADLWAIVNAWRADWESADRAA